MLLKKQDRQVFFRKRFYMSEITIIEIGDTIIVPIQVELHDRSARKLQEDILKKIEVTRAKGLIIDISALSIVDTFLGRLLGDTAKMAKLMGTETVLVGMRKEVVITLLQLGMFIKNLNTSPNVERGLTLLESLKGKKEGVRWPTLEIIK
jgi:rsbT antagonist protein RsbS